MNYVLEVDGQECVPLKLLKSPLAIMRMEQICDMRRNSARNKFLVSAQLFRFTTNKQNAIISHTVESPHRSPGGANGRDGPHSSHKHTLTQSGPVFLSPSPLRGAGMAEMCEGVGDGAKVVGEDRDEGSE